MHILLDGFVAGPNGEMNWIKVDEEIFDHVGKRIKWINFCVGIYFKFIVNTYCQKFIPTELKIMGYA